MSLIGPFAFITVILLARSRKYICNSQSVVFIRDGQNFISSFLRSRI